MSTADVAAPTERSAPARTWAPVAWVALGVATGVLMILPGGDDDGLTSMQPTTVIGIAVLGYLTAAVAGRRWVGWVAAWTFAVLVVVAGALDVPRTAVLVASAVILTGIGLVLRPRLTVPQALAAAGYLGVALIALALAPRIGLAIAGLALVAHVVWDVLHYRRDAVVTRSLALWCIGLDLVVGGACVVAAVAG
ncbi:hypothetical protein [Cellulomonas xylanilytica]|uniref:Uncharacterized protein n=1 Tax=Cellulomonas xylanilytica TaxID=233583 RepID=A0A510V998_9CELL|nr:hypothetical protein [Cellulomonas xylanilytica]GEK23316.1 hypothetical protein CXY01_38360 [Cellulomonas xylanilytica]